MDLVTTAHPDRPELDMALTEQLLRAAARGERPETMRVFRPGPTVAFGRLDRNRAGFDEACRIALAHGRAPVVRLGGGHAAAYDRDCVIVEVIRRHERSGFELESRFAGLAEMISWTLAKLGVTLQLGELPNEYCAGRFSLHLPSGPKVAGVAQRILTRASLTTAVIVVSGGDTLRAVLADVYAALDLPFDPDTAGALTDRYPDVTCELVQQTIIAAGQLANP
jgi:octanoyl-[GcvH]:protein N-octanoyltransferase